MIADERWLELARANTQLADGIWDGMCPPTADRPLFADGMAELIVSARGPATPDEHAAEGLVVARMQEAVLGVTNLERPRHRRQRALQRIAAAKVAAIVVVVALGAATASGATSEVISLVWGWVDDLAPSTTTDQPQGGETPTGSARRGGTGSEMHDQDNLPSAQLGETGPPPTARSGALSGVGGSSLGQTDEVSGEDAGDDDVATSTDSESSSGHDGSEPAQDSHPADSGRGRPSGDGPPPGHRGPPGPSGPLADGDSGGLPGDGGVPPGLQMSPWGGANPAQSDAAAAES